jgi:hypothetical protein
LRFSGRERRSGKSCGKQGRNCNSHGRFPSFVRPNYMRRPHRAERSLSRVDPSHHHLPPLVALAAPYDFSVPLDRGCACR